MNPNTVEDWLGLVLFRMQLLYVDYLNDIIHE